MKRTLGIMIFVVSFSLIAASAHAGLIDYNRKNKKYQKNASTAPKETPKAAVKAATQKAAQADHKVANRLEDAYDSNHDGYLQKAESNELLANVVGVVEKKGSLKVDSDLLKKFDVNNDGLIGTSEVAAIQAAMR